MYPTDDVPRKEQGMRLACYAVMAVFLTVVAYGQSLEYPVAKKVDQVDTYFGVKVADPYRWLEDENSPETAGWVKEENKLTFRYLDNIPFRARLKGRLEELFNYPKYTAPFKNGKLFFFYKNDGLQNQSVLYYQEGLKGIPHVLLDPNTFAANGTTRLLSFVLSRDGSSAAYGISLGGSDWEEYCTMDMSTRTTTKDTLKWVKVSNIAWLGKGFYYSRYDAPAAGKELSSKNENHKVYFHRLGTTQASDSLVYEDPSHPQRFNIVQTSEDERFVLLSVSERGSGKDGNALFFRDAAKGMTGFKPVIATIGDDSYDFVDDVDGKLIVRTNHNAPNGRVVLIDPDHPEESQWKELIAEKPEPMENATSAGGKLFVTWMKDVTSRAYVYNLDGTLDQEIALPDLGTVSGFGGKKEDPFVFYSFTSFTIPPTIYRYDIASHTSTLFRTAEIPGYTQSEYVTEQVFFPSKDGTRIPMFLVHKKGIEKNGKNPTLLYGYGGFAISVAPTFSSMRLALLEQGVLFASANLRGGGEYGEKWHQAGTKLHKQNVFDDFIAASEWLIAQGYTSPEHLAIQGGSNGGLLVGAVVNQRPELYRVAIAQVGVMDMLRFHKFTIGWNWIPDYGSSDNDSEFKALYAYSPLQNIRPGKNYPPMLITTADHDDRVVPGHSFKYAATMQADYHGPNPILIRIDTQSGHGASSTAKTIETTCDVDAFLLYNLGVHPAE